jgi:hypothetical protein
MEHLQKLKYSFQASYNTERHTLEKLKQEIQQLQKQIIVGKTLAEAKENIWMDISKSMTKIWPLVHIMFEQHELVLRSRQAVDRIKGELGEIPIEANEIIKFLNSKAKDELESMEIEDRTETTLEVKKVLTKRRLMFQLEERAQNMDIGVQIFFSNIDASQNKGLPILLVLNDKPMTLSDYKQKIAIVEKDNSKFSGIQGSITGKSFLETLQLDLSIQHEIKYIFITKPTSAKYTEMDEVYRRLLKVTIPNQQRCEDLCALIE